jgi:hypothetical protein
MRRRLAGLAVPLVVLAGTAHAGEIPSPHSVLGFRMGEDRKLADWTEIVGYFRRLDAASPRVQVEDFGPTTEGRPFLLVTISSEANLARLEELRQANLRLWDPRGLADDEARRLLEQGRTIVALNHGIHSTEVAAPHTAMETAYRLASSREPEIAEILDETVVLMLPSHNPDGTQKVTEWYRRTLGTPYEGAAPPFLYQKYVGHDNNRDWYMFTQVESRLTLSALHDRWRPQIVHDLHQMGTRGARIFTPPYLDPWEPNVDPALVAAVNALGAHVAARLVSAGLSGVVSHALYDAWTPARSYPVTHGGVRFLTECASVRLASPIEVKPEELLPGTGYDPRRASWNFPAPWPGGTWRLRDIVDYQLAATQALLGHAAKHRRFWLENFLAVNRRAAARREPFAFVVPAEQADPRAARRLLEVMRLGGVELHRARDGFSAGGSAFAAGSHVIPMAQPASAFAKTLLERQDYPELRAQPGGPLQRPYDVTAHSLPLLLGVDVRAVREPFEAGLDPVVKVVVAPGRLEPARARWYALGHKNAELLALGRLLEDGVAVRWAAAAFEDTGRRFPAGTLFVPGSARRQLSTLARELGIEARGVGARPPALALRQPRVGLYQSWLAPMDEGWTRYVFEHEAGVPYRTLRDADVRAGNLARRFDAIVLPDQSRRELLQGQARGSLPDEYCGGLGPEGVAALKEFVSAGGTLIALNAASELPIAEFGLSVTNVLAGVKAGDFYGPGSLLRAAADASHPLAHGLGETTPLWFEESPAFEVGTGRVVLRYAETSPLLSGFLQGGDRLLGKAALVEAPLGRGKVVLFGFRPQYRAQSWATYIPFLNALYLSAAEGP